MQGKKGQKPNKSPSLSGQEAPKGSTLLCCSHSCTGKGGEKGGKGPQPKLSKKERRELQEKQRAEKVLLTCCRQ